MKPPPKEEFEKIAEALEREGEDPEELSYWKSVYSYLPEDERYDIYSNLRKELEELRNISLRHSQRAARGTSADNQSVYSKLESDQTLGIDKRAAIEKMEREARRQRQLGNIREAEVYEKNLRTLKGLEERPDPARNRGEHVLDLRNKGSRR